MKLSIEVQTKAGVKLGAGPILSASDWTSNPKLDGAGTFSFTMPAADPKSLLLGNELVVLCYSILNDVMTLFGGGIIDKIEKNPSTPTLINVSGQDLLSELADITVGNLVLREQIWTYLNEPTKGTLQWLEVRWVQSETKNVYYSGALPSASDGNPATSENISIQSMRVGYPEDAGWLYIGYDARFCAIRFNFRTPSAEPLDPTINAQYYSGDSNGWVNLAVVDGTNPGTGTWRQSGDMTFTPPADWVRYDEALVGAGNWFWVRMRSNPHGPANPITITADTFEVSIYADFPTLNGVDQIMAFAPLWTTDPTPAPTVWPKYLEFQGESVLTALLMLAEQGGQDAGQAIREHFRLGTGRVVDWLGITITPTGLRAVKAYKTTTKPPELVLITDLKETLDTSEIVNRIFGWSGDGVGIVVSDRTPPAGYSYAIDPTRLAPYLQRDASVALYGPIELWTTFSEIRQQQTQTLTTQVVYTANAVYDAMIEYLRTHAELVRHYSLEVTRFAGLIQVGKTIEVVYHEYRNLEHTVDIDTYRTGKPLWITGASLKVSTNGVATQRLEVATIDRDNISDADIVVELVREKRRALGNVTSIMGSGGVSVAIPPSAGPDIRVSGYQVSRAGAGVLLFSGNGLVLREYAATEAGIVAAFAASAVGDIVEVPAGLISLATTLAVPAGRALRGRGWHCILGGYVTLGVGAIADDFKVYQSLNTASDTVGISGPGAAGECYVRDVFVKIVNAGSGKALGLLGTGTGEMHVYGETKVRVNGGTGSRWAAYGEDDSAVIYHHGNVKAWIGA